MRRTTALTHLVTCCALAVALSGCGSANPKPAPPASESVTSASPSVVAPTMPAAAMGTGPEAAKAFVRHYLATFSYAARTGDVRPLRVLALRSCASCRHVTDQIAKVYGAGGYARGRGYGAGPMHVEPAVELTIRVTVIQFPQVSKQSATASTVSHGKTLLPSRFTLTRTGDSWRIAGWQRL
jgi:hypothetical protein